MRAIFTRRMLEQQSERTPEPWRLITADGAAESQAHQQHPRLEVLLQLARIQHPLSREGRLVGTNLRDMAP